MAYGLWLMAYGLWLMAYGVWRMAYSLCSKAAGKIRIEKEAVPTDQS
jgi:hypothetical protein